MGAAVGVAVVRVRLPHRVGVRYDEHDGAARLEQRAPVRQHDVAQLVLAEGVDEVGAPDLGDARGRQRQRARVGDEVDAGEAAGVDVHVPRERALAGAEVEPQGARQRGSVDHGVVARPGLALARAGEQVEPHVLDPLLEPLELPRGVLRAALARGERGRVG